MNKRVRKKLVKRALEKVDRGIEPSYKEKRALELFMRRNVKPTLINMMKTLRWGFSVISRTVGEALVTVGEVLKRVS